jgi:hypothetical protein
MLGIERNTMGRTITNPTRSGEKPERNWRSPESRERCAKAGAANLAAWRAANPQTHGVVRFLRNGALSAEISNKLDEFEAGLLSDLGSEPTSAQKALVESTRTSLGVVLLANAYLAQDGLSKLKKNKWLLSVLATFVNTTRLNLQALGLERRATGVLTLDSVLADIASKRAQDAPEAAPVENVARRMESRA